MVCVYDNPATMAREAWQNGRLLLKLDALVLLDANFRRSGLMPFMLNVGPWSDGKAWGDIKAMSLPA